MSEVSDKEKKIFKIKKLEPGDEFYSYDGYLNHVISIVYDGDRPFVFYKYWIKHKRYYGYAVQNLELVLYSICILIDLSKKERRELYKANGLEFVSLSLYK